MSTTIQTALFELSDLTPETALAYLSALQAYETNAFAKHDHFYHAMRKDMRELKLSIGLIIPDVQYNLKPVFEKCMGHLIFIVKDYASAETILRESSLLLDMY